jgi:hypothetical protein
MRIILLVALLATSIFAQHRGGSAPGGRVSAPSYSRPPAPVRAPSPVRPYYPRSPVYVPYGVFVGGGYYAQPLASDYGYANPAPVAIVNQDFQPDSVNPSIIDFSNVPQAEPAAVESTNENGLRDDEPTIFLIALTDHTVVAAIAYWVDGDTLNWVSRDAKQNHMSLSLVDRDFSKQLNDERHVAFKLHPAQ